jgi:hypothetical protein
MINRHFPVRLSSSLECVITTEGVKYYDLIPTPRKAIEECQMPIKKNSKFQKINSEIKKIKILKFKIKKKIPNFHSKI